MGQKKDTKTNKIQHTKKALVEALVKTMGIVTPACKLVGIDRSTFYKYVKDDEDFAAEVKDVKDIALDFSESKLLKAIQNDNLTAVIFHLKTQGKKRGYIERTEMDAQITEKNQVFSIDGIDFKFD